MTTTITTVLKNIPCPLCGTDNPTPLSPSMKFDPRLNRHAFRSDIQLCLCEHCGLLFENPQVLLEESPDYTNKHYYNSRNRIETHDTLQKVLNAYRWHMLKDRLPWQTGWRVLDVGASGAWSDLVLQKIEGAESVLIEPSGEAVARCRANYPRVQANHGPFETFDDHDASYDLITFFYSFYCLSKPREGLEKVRRLLKPGGHVMICISHLRMETEIWSKDEPWIDLDLFIRGTPLVYYSRHTLEKILELSGFRIVDQALFQFPDFDHLRGRQEQYVIAAVDPSLEPLSHEALRAPDEVEESRAFVTRFCEIVSDNSIRAFLRAAPVRRVIVAHDNDLEYTAWVTGLLGRHGIFVETVFAGDVREGRYRLVDEEGCAVLLVGRHMLEAAALASRLARTKVYDCALAGKVWLPNWIRSTDGQMQVTRAVCPYRGFNGRLFPFNRRRPDNDVTKGTDYYDLPWSVDRHAINGQTLNIPLPRSLGDWLDFGALLLLTMPETGRAALACQLTGTSWDFEEGYTLAAGRQMVWQAMSVGGTQPGAVAELLWKIAEPKTKSHLGAFIDIACRNFVAALQADTGRPRILFVSAQYTGGLARRINQMQAKGYDCFVLNLFRRDRLAEEDNYGCRHRLDLSAFYLLGRNRNELAQLIAALPCDVLWFETTISAYEMVDAVMTCSRGTPIICEFHDIASTFGDERYWGLSEEAERARALHEIEGRIFGRADAIIYRADPVVKDFLLKMHRRLPPRLVSMPMGVLHPIHAKDPATAKPPLRRLVYAGSLVPEPQSGLPERFVLANMHLTFRTLLEQGFAIDVYNALGLVNWRHHDKRWNHFLRLETEFPGFHMRDPKPASTLVEQLRDYDFGLILSDIDPDKTLLRRSHFEYNYGTKNPLYLQAGLPVIMNAEFAMHRKLAEEHGIGLAVWSCDIPRLSDIVDAADYAALCTATAAYAQSHCVDAQAVVAADVVRGVLQDAAALAPSC